MAYTLQAHFQARLDVTEIVDATTSPASGGAGGNRRTYDQYGTDVNLHDGAQSFPEISGQAADLSHTLAAVDKDFDLTAAPWAGDITKTFSALGKKLVAIELRFHKNNNAAGVQVGGHGANAYGLFSGTVKPVFYPGAALVLGIVDPTQAAAVTNNWPTVAAGAKDLRFTGTISDSWVCKLIFTE
jgi:hypothetical protein